MNLKRPPTNHLRAAVSVSIFRLKISAFQIEAKIESKSKPEQIRKKRRRTVKSATTQKNGGRCSLSGSSNPPVYHTEACPLFSSMAPLKRKCRKSDNRTALERRLMGAQSHAGPVCRLARIRKRIPILHHSTHELMHQVRMRPAVSRTLGE